MTIKPGNTSAPPTRFFRILTERKILGSMVEQLTNYLFKYYSGKDKGAGLDSIKERIAKFDSIIDDYVVKARGNKIADRTFYTASELGDFGLLWVILAILRALRGGKLNEKAGLRAVVATGIESTLVNVFLKSIFHRSRPVVEIEHPLPLRQPLSSSFPSGHATAAFCAAMLLAEKDDIGWFYFLLAFIVASSRVYVRIHHSSDVIGGIFVGLLLGAIGRMLVPLRPKGRGN